MSIEKRPNGRWRARVTLPDRTQRAKHFRTRAEAARWEAEQRATLNRGQWIDPSDRTTVTEYAYRWASMRPHRPSTARNVESLIRHHIAGTKLGERRLAAVRPSEVQAWASDRATRMSPLRLRNLVSMVRSIFRDAVLDRLMAENPATRVALPRFERPRVVPLTVEQVNALTAAMPARNRAMVIVQAGTGVRLGELLALRVDDVDFLRRTVRVRHQFAPQSKVRTLPKTPRSLRVIPVPAFVTDAIAEHLRHFPAGEDGTIFTTRFGTPYRHDYYGSMIFKAAAKRAGLPPETTTHDLRHTYVSLLLAAGEAVTTVADRVGHANPGVTLAVYSHLMPGKDEGTRRAIEAAFAGQNRDQDHATGL